MRFDNAFGLGIALVGTDAYFEPLRLTYSFGHYFNSLLKKLVNRVYRCNRVFPP